MITDPPVLYWFPANSVVEVMNVPFASLDVVWHFIEKVKIPLLRHTNEVIEAYLAASPRWKLHLLLGLITGEVYLL